MVAGRSLTTLARLSKAASSSFSSSLFRSMATASGSTAEERIASLGYKLPPAAKSVGNYVMCTRVGNLIYTGEAFLPHFLSVFLSDFARLHLREPGLPLS